MSDAQSKAPASATPGTNPPASASNHVSGSTLTAGTGAQAEKPRTFPCDGCGADLTFSIGQQSLACGYCGQTQALSIPEGADVRERDFRATLERLSALRGKGNTDAAGTKELTCRQCGGTAVFTGTLTSTHCPWCGTPIQRDNVHDAKDRVPVDGVLPFQVDRPVAAANLKRWVASRWFAPNEFLRRGVDAVFSGVYLPYWTFDAMTATRYTGMRGEHYYVTVGSGRNARRVRQTRWYPASGTFQTFFDDVLACASAGLPRDILMSLEPWPLAKCIPFTQAALAGLLARTYDVALDQSFSHDAKPRVESSLRAEVRGRIGGDAQQITSMDTAWSALTYKHLLLPVWLLAYRYGGKSYQAAVNAATGEVQGQRPWSWIKITLAVLAGLVAAGIAFMLSDH